MLQRRSSIRPVSMGKNRQVYLDGEAYFEVTKNEEKPFVVKLNKQDITVLGTTFNVQAYENESYSVVTLLSGRIMLEAFNEFSESTGRMFMKPNQCAWPITRADRFRCPK